MASASSITTALSASAEQALDVKARADGLNLTRVMLEAPQLAQDIQKLSVTIRGAVLTEAPSWSEDDQKKVVADANTFIKAERQLLSALIEKAATIRVVGDVFAAPLAQATRMLEDVSSNVLLGIEKLTPACGADLKQGVDDLRADFKRVDTVYSG
ncbi:hypothetical protein BDW74DRAFT_162336 [Aspergillus multicolor]|uniref:uncharacterized protein n=1 Tax=Aspergillus multicolor TaxID=41759 RepID=UPI003CCDB403